LVELSGLIEERGQVFCEIGIHPKNYLSLIINSFEFFS